MSVPTLPPGVLIHSPRNLDFVFKNDSLFTKGSFVKTRAWDLFGKKRRTPSRPVSELCAADPTHQGNGIINAEGDLWKLQRKAGAAFLNPANLRVLTEVALPQYLSESIADLESSIDSAVVDLQHVFLEITSKLMGKMAYNVGQLPNPGGWPPAHHSQMEMHADDDFSQAFDFASGATAERFQNPLWFITELFTGSKLRKSIAVVKDFGRRIVAKAVEDRRSEPQTQKSSDGSAPDADSKLDRISGSLIQSLLDALGNQDVVADAALTYLSAGRDTTGQALTWTFYLLMRHPEVTANIRREVQRLLDDQPPQPPGPLNPTLFTPASVPYTMAVFYETLRLYPPIPFEIRQCQAAAATTLPDGTLLPRHSVLVWCLWAMQRSRLTWGADADAFRPERFLDADADADAENGGRLVAAPRPPGEFPVFFGGARTCLGRRMAEAIAAQVIPAVAWRLELEPAWEGGERVSSTSLTMPMEGGLPVRVRRRRGVD